ncbi:C40 family peptidase [Streptomyces sp. TLI_171]|uniref:C40 family peptidase n=1 Tax=Streptomyces sp. TLI_171 TaxID=1938859 RepID=UPI000C190288|nr:C40 family peptidase [Streptomyces sp. TLI_171]RKE22271.1 cell wall-associated NlpC family hydrolase [Streptomyces sp. TLI_171]
MATHRRPRPAGRSRTAVLGAAAGAAVLLPVATASAEPTANLDQVKAKVDGLYEEAEAATEQYNKVDERSKQLQSEAGKLQDRLAGQQGRILQLRETLGALAAEQYRTGGLDPSVQLMLSSSPDAYLSQAGLQGLAAAQQSETLRSALRLQQSIDQERAETAAKLAELEQARSTLAAKKTEIQARLAEAGRILAGLRAADRARVLGDDTQAASRTATRGQTYTGPATGQVRAILDFAYAQLGKPYQWGAEGPGSYDCSGLTQAAFRAGGIALPRVTQDQWNAGKHVARADLQPGDLLFYYRDLHHVGLYLGNGKLLHAPRTGKNVEIVDMNVMPYMGAVRP